MKLSKILLLTGLAIALTSCGITKPKTSTSTTPTTSEKPTPEVGTSVSTVVKENKFVARKTKMSKEEVQKWPHMDIYTDSVPGMSLAKAYKFLEGKKGETVIVGVIDSGIDIEHEDLKNLVWTNEDEIPNNGIDDDNNGYIDDIHGWNFLGGENAASPERLEVTRLVAKMNPKYKGKTSDQIAPEDVEEFKYYTKLADEVAAELKGANGQKAFYQGMISTALKADKVIAKGLGKEIYTADELEKFVTDDKDVVASKPMLGKFLENGSIKEGIESLQGAVDYFTSKIDFMYNVDFNGRVTGDDPDDFSDNKYGNNFTMGSKDDEIHGTHVSGIILAQRNNGVGMNGVTTNAVLMSVRAVPDGDEYDKDVALAIRYVVDNGAKVVNMSFGKPYSPHSKWVYDAIKYAADHDVLLVKAAGNDAANIDSHFHYPTDSPEAGNIEIADNVLTIGAISRHLDADICATFSNYGQTRVDIFAPGHQIYATFPKNNYQSISGTSMASPEVAGVAALVRSYYPNLTASEVKHIIMDSGVAINMNVKQPAERGSTGAMVPFKTLSISGKVLNAYNALVRAEKYSKDK